MPDIDWNKHTWEGAAKWYDGGDRWSAGWGSPERQWLGSILPRIDRFLPTGTVLELGPGFGRWTQFLQNMCESLIAVDLSRGCIEACRTRFREQDKIRCYANDGKSLEMVPDDSVDFVFSYDSLVHVESDVIEAYLTQLAVKMKKDAAGFIHHSNLAHYGNYFRRVRGIPLLRVFMRAFGYATRTHDRGASVSAEKFAQLARTAGLQCIGQEWVNWDSPLLIDCFSTFTKQGSVWDGENRVTKNPCFMDEARRILQGANPLPQRRAA